MWQRIVVCVMCSGCAFRASSTGDDGPARDAATGDGAARDGSAGTQDGAPDGSTGSTDCFGHWFAGDLTISAPQELTTLSTTGNERDPWISVDGRTLHYAVDPQGPPTSDIYRATRASVGQPFGNATALINLNRSDADEGRAALTEDEKLLVLSSNRSVNKKFDLYIATRPNTMMDFPSPDGIHLNNVNAGNSNNFDPYLTRDGLKLYLSPLPSGSPQHIFVATRADTNSDFSPLAQVPAINSQSTDADPALTLDERIIVFSSTRNGGSGRTDLWYATRQNATDNFGTPKHIPVVSSAQDDGDPMLSADGCELYFSSTRNGADYDLYVAQITK